MERKLKQFVQVFQNSIDPIGIFTLDDKVIDVNPAFEKMFGYKREELIGGVFLGHIGFDDGVFDKWIELCKYGNGVKQHFTRRRAKDGKIIAVSITVSPIFDLEGNLSAVSISYRDITELLQSRQALQLQDVLMQNINDAVISTNIEATIVTWNKAAERIYGYSAQDAIGKNLSDFTKTDLDSQSQHEIYEVLIKAGYWRGTIKQYTKRGKLLYIDSLATWILDSSGNRSGIVVVNRDITEIKINEDKVINSEIEKSTILNNQSDLIILQDLNNRIIWANDTALRSAGKTIDEVRDLYCFEIWGDPNKSCDYCSIEKVKKSKKTEIFERTDHNGKTWSIKGTPIFDKDGNIYRILEVAEDITEIKSKELFIADNEAKYRNLVGHAPIAIVVFQDLTPVFCNPKALEVLGFSNLEEFQKIDFFTFVHPEDRDYLTKIKEKIEELRKAPFNANFRIITSNGNIKYLITTTTFFTVNGEGFFQSIILDNTELAELTAVHKNLAVESIYLNQKNKLIEEIRRNIDSISEKYNFSAEDRKKYDKLFDNYFQPERDWMVSKSHFEAVHKDFFSILKTKFPKLTQNELRHCAYIKMNYTTKEIARIFNVEPSSIQKARLRMKRKMQLSQNDDLYMYIMSI